MKPYMKEAYDRLEAIGEDEILDVRSGGASVRAIQKKYNVTVRQLYGWIGKAERNRKAEIDGVCRRERWNEATIMGAEAKAAKADERLEVLIDPETGRMLPTVTREEVALAKALAEQERWNAGNMDPGGFRQNQPAQAATVQVNVGQLLLQALERAPTSRPRLPAPAIPEAEFEVVDDDPNPLALDD